MLAASPSPPGTMAHRSPRTLLGVLRALALGTTACLAVAVSATAHAQDGEVDVDALWDTYDAQATQYEDLQSQCDEGDRATTYINRICREAAETSLALADTIEALIAHDTSLEDGDRALLVDGMLTNRQIAGALWVELGECETGRDILRGVIAHPEVTERPLVLQAAENYAERADECIAAATAPDPLVENSGGTTAPVLVMSTGLAFLAGGVVWDLAQISPRGEFEDLRDDCIDGCNATDFQRLERLKENLDRSKVPIAILYGAGGAAAVGGAIWYAVRRSSGRDEESTVQLAPTFGAGFTGAELRVQF